MLLDTDRDRNIDVIGKKVSIFCRTHIAVGYRIQEGSPGRLRLRYAVGRSRTGSGMEQEGSKAGVVYISNFIQIVLPYNP